jgi:citrate lyase subunit beta / citryl-CoA lyase
MIRSLLYVPADQERFIAKAHERGADAIILDLEDAVAPAHKDAARAALTDAVPAVGRSGARVFVRVNAEPELLAADAEAACRAGAHGLYVPKAREVSTFARLDEQLAALELSLDRPPVQLVALIEDAAGVLDARILARAPRVMALTAGGEDLALSLGGQPTPEVLRLPKLLVHYAAKAEGLQSFGLLRSVTDYADTEAMTAAAREARMHGFDGATCVHPALVPILNSGFALSEAELDWARRVVAASEDGAGAFVVDGKMVDAPVVARARAMLGRGR